MPWNADGERVLDPLTREGMQLVGAAVKRRRLRLGLSQTRLEHMTGIDQTTISRLERGRRRGLRWSRFTLLVAVLGGLDFGDLAGIGAYGRRRAANPYPVALAAGAHTPSDGVSSDPCDDVSDEDAWVSSAVTAEA